MTTTPDLHGLWGSPSATSAPDPYAPPVAAPAGSGSASPYDRRVDWAAEWAVTPPAGVPVTSADASPVPYPFVPPAPAAARGSGGLAVAGLVLGSCAVALLVADTWFASGAVSAAGLVLAVLGLVLGVVGLAGARAGAGRHGVAVAGVTASAVAAVLAASVLVVFGAGTWPASALGGEVALPVLSLRPGESAPIGEYTVTVDEIQMDADAALATDRRNSPADGRYVQAVVTVVYEGTGQGSVEDDLLVSYAGSSDDWLYDELTCGATTDRPVHAVEPLAPGARATFVACMDVPADVVQDTAVIVEDLTSWEFVAETWGVR